MTTTFIGKPNDWYADILVAIVEWKGDEAMRVYGLKRATPRMKYQHMRDVMEFKNNLAEAQIAEAERRAKQNQEYFLDLRDALMWLDPQGWSEWYDAYVPDWSGWLYAGPAIETLERRAEELMQEYLGGLTFEELERVHSLVVAHEEDLVRTI